MAEENPSLSHVKLKGAFAIDSPVDILDLFGNFERGIEKKFSEAGVAKYLIALMTKEFGEPKNNVKRYEELTSFHKEKKTPGNEKYLKDLSVRLYHEIEVNWHLKNRRRSIYDNNYLNASELINRLLLSGSTKCEFIQSDRVGYRSNGMRHPHSWFIVDENEFIEWVNRVLE
jgi:hypothetical protein